MKIPSSYRYYKLSDLENICGISISQVENLLSPVQDVLPSDLFHAILQRNLQMPMHNEKAKSELIVMPILVEMWAINQRFKPLSGLTFNIDSSKGLKGVCDFIISSKLNAVELKSPVVCIFEAKDDSTDNWHGQCGSEMYAAQIFNEREGNNIKIIYGAVTNGFTWQFLKLENQILFIDSQRYAIANLPQLLGAIQKIYNLYK